MIEIRSLTHLLAGHHCGNRVFDIISSTSLTETREMDREHIVFGVQECFASVQSGDILWLISAQMETMYVGLTLQGTH